MSVQAPGSSVGGELRHDANELARDGTPSPSVPLSRKRAASIGEIDVPVRGPSHFDFAVGVRAVKALRVAPPALRAAYGLDRPIANPERQLSPALQCAGTERRETIDNRLLLTSDLSAPV